MSRDIKFRGQDFETGEWIYGSYNGLNAGAADVFIIYEKEIFDPVSFGFIDTEIVEREVKEETVGQFTGLKDRNGVEIYEGDILEYISPEPQDDDHTDRYVVEWRVKEFVGVWLKDRLFKNRDNDGLIDPHLDMLVIGNIWENPELLEVGE